VSLKQLRHKIQDKTAILSVIGLGYVGLPVAALFAEAGFRMIGVDLKDDRVDLINSGKSPIGGNEPGLANLIWKVVNDGKFWATTEYEPLHEADIVLIAVETPIDPDRIPRFEALSAALRNLAEVLPRGALVIIESTIAPGTMDRFVRPMLEEVTGYRAGEELYLGHCPERVMPGKLLLNMRTIARVCGADSMETGIVMKDLYKQIVEADVEIVDCVTAELVKTAENTYRDVNIAFANELALICEAAGGDVWKVRELVNKVPGRNVLLPGAGVGGHCLPKDPWLLVYGAEGADLPIRLISAAREINDGMPKHILDLTIDSLKEVGKDIAQSKVLVLGYAYLENSDDDRNSPSSVLAELLRNRGAEVVIHDPLLKEFRGDVLALALGCDAAIGMVKHNAYKSLQAEDLVNALNTPVIVDGRNIFDRESLRRAGAIFRVCGVDL
jgi:UDP-N-acetyl-D-mannosaminuronic acid dehydrogenase